jgi:hypothetical protein
MKETLWENNLNFAQDVTVIIYVKLIVIVITVLWKKGDIILPLLVF